MISRVKSFFKNQNPATNHFSDHFSSIPSQFYIFYIELFRGDIDAIRSIATPSLSSVINLFFLFFTINNLQELASKIYKNSKDGKRGQNIKFVNSPSIIQILPIKINAATKALDMYQITVKFEYYVDSEPFINYIVFERSATASNSKWRICGRVVPNHT